MTQTYLSQPSGVFPIQTKTLSSIVSLSFSFLSFPFVVSFPSFVLSSVLVSFVASSPPVVSPFVSFSSPAPPSVRFSAPSSGWGLIV